MISLLTRYHCSLRSILGHPGIRALIVGIYAMLTCTTVWADIPHTSHLGTKQPARLISLAPHITELLYAAGAQKALVATVNSSDYPPEAQSLPRIGDGLTASLEAILALEPTTLLFWQPSNLSTRLEPWADTAGFTIVFNAPASLNDIIETIDLWGKQLNTEHSAQQTTTQLKSRLEQLRHRYQNKEVITAFIEVGGQPLYTIGNDPLLNSALSECGIRNLYGEQSLPAPQVSAEDVVLKQPELIILPVLSAERLTERTRYWSKLGVQAAKKQQITGIDADLLFRPGPRLFDAIESLCAAADRLRETD